MISSHLSKIDYKIIIIRTKHNQKLTKNEHLHQKSITMQSEIYIRKITISSYERFENPKDVVYYAIFEDDNLYFQAEFTNDQNNAELTKLTISLNAIEQ